MQNDRIQGLIDSNPNYNSPSDIPFAYIPRDHRYRQNTTDDEREAVFGSVQFQPNDRLDIMFDFQYSERDQREMRRDLQWGSTQEDISALTSNPYTGIVTSSVSETTIHSYTTDFQRLEEYEGFGLNVDFMVTDRLTLNLDYAESETTRRETDVELRLGATDNNLVFGNRDDFTVQLDTQRGTVWRLPRSLMMVAMVLRLPTLAISMHAIVLVFGRVRLRETIRWMRSEPT